MLATHPDKEARLLQELHALASGSGGGGGAEAGQSAAAAYASLDLEARAPYLAAVWSEALRLYPPGTIAVRLSRPGLDLGGLALPAGSNVQVSIYSMQRSRRYWNDALDFRPERFLPGAPEALAPPPGAFLPFGDGARKCIGYKFATQEGLLALAAIYTRVRIWCCRIRCMGPVAMGPWMLQPWPERLARSACSPRARWPRLCRSSHSGWSLGRCRCACARC